jgi:hypothetical protein
MAAVKALISLELPKSIKFDSIVNVYLSDKKLFMIWDNARIHTSKTVEEFINEHNEMFMLNS